MILYHDPSCAEYGSHMRPEQPARILRTVPHLKAAHPAWEWRIPGEVDDALLLTAHAPALVKRIAEGPDLDEDTPHFPGIERHARRAVAGALDAAHAALAGARAFSLMRPPGHHCTRNQAMGFCYLNQVALAALNAQGGGSVRVAVWDFDAHHGNGTEDILEGKPGVFFASVHQYPGYPGTGTRSTVNCRNYPVKPHTPRDLHMADLARSWEAVLNFKPDLDEDTPHFPGIERHARRAVAGALDAAHAALAGDRAFSLMRPPGHHCTRNQAMGFCTSTKSPSPR